MIRLHTNWWIVVLLLCGLASAGCGGDEANEEGAAAATEGGSAGILPLETFLTNIADTSGERHARVQMKLVVTPDEIVEEMKADVLLMARLHDRALTLLTAKTREDLTSSSGKENFRGEVRTELNGLLSKGEIKEVLFSDFVVE